MNFHSILAITNLSPQGNRAVLRAAMLAARRRALLKIMYAPSHLGAFISTGVEQDVKRLAAEIYRRFDILVKNVADTSGHLEAVAEEARWADLLVVGEHWNPSFKAFFCGQPIERLQRNAPCPILLARLEVVDRYRRILVAIDSAPNPNRLLKLARSLDRNAEVEPFHALKTKLSGLVDEDLSEQALEACQHESTGNAQEHLFRATDSPTARPSRVATMTGRSDGARQAATQQLHSNADLIVVGKPRRSGFSDFVFGNVAHRVLRLSSRDVLLVPLDLRIDPAAETMTSSMDRRDQLATQHAVGSRG
ncbi:universal stress protein [Variovorax sp. J22R24]|uniref:universal stress protein n=1 Tax=Variovorax gracilis TaxID=3053502 RepID=UPI002577D42D|nr:universal stress protein [Variovorax sp. J22R24]MDM0110093.1 universal stress protein [Variovorax sp. J22R24]